MRKLILLAIALGAYEYLRRDAAKSGTTPSEAFSEKLSSALAWLSGLGTAPAAAEE